MCSTSIPADGQEPIYHKFSIAKKSIKIEGPLVTVPSGPWFGIEVDWTAVRAHLCPDAQSCPTRCYG